MSKPEFVYVIYVHSTPEKIWQALIDPEMTREFWGRHRNNSDWKPGSEWRHQNYDDSSDVSVAGTVIESDPPRRLVLTWARPNHEDVSRVTFEIDEFMGSAKLTVTHRELTDEAMRGISAGWPAVLSSLKTLLETGASLPMTRQHWRKAS